MKAIVASFAMLIVFCGLALAQDAPQAPEEPNPPMPPPRAGGPGGHGPRMGPRGEGKWWKDSALMQKLGVSDDQVQRIEKIFQDHRLRLIDLHADLQKQEVILEPLIDADQPDEAQVIAQIDKVAQARANLEKSNAQMLLAIRRVLTLEQWKKLRDMPGVAPRSGTRFGPPAPGGPQAPPTPPPTGD